jgi:hypothetical protein
VDLLARIEPERNVDGAVLLAVREIVGVHPGEVFTQEFDVDFVMRITELLMRVG